MGDKEELKEKLRALFSKKGVFILGIAGILLIGLSSFLPAVSKKGNTLPDFSEEEYREATEEKVLKIVRKISGDENAEAVVTLATGKRYSYADETSESKEEKSDKNGTNTTGATKKNYITVKTDDGEKALVLAEYMPEIRGVAIVVSACGNEEMINEIKNAVTAALDITSKRIYIADCGRKSE